MSGGQVSIDGAPDVIYGEFLAGGDLFFMAYITDDDGTVLESSDFTASQAFITVYQRSGATPTTPVYSTLIGGASNGFVSDLSTTGWTRGGSGYNFSARIISTAFDTFPGLTYRYEFSLARTSGGRLLVVFELFAKGAV